MKKVFVLLLAVCFSVGIAQAQQATKSELHQRAESEMQKGSVAGARFSFIRAFEEYTRQGQLKVGMECATRGAALYYKDNYWKEAFDLLRRADAEIDARSKNAKEKAALHRGNSRQPLGLFLRFIFQNVCRHSGAVFVQHQIIPCRWYDPYGGREQQLLYPICRRSGAVDNRTDRDRPPVCFQIISVFICPHGSHMGIQLQPDAVSHRIFTGGDAQLPGIDRSRSL